MPGEHGRRPYGDLSVKKCRQVRRSPQLSVSSIGPAFLSGLYANWRLLGTDERVRETWQSIRRRSSALRQRTRELVAMVNRRLLALLLTWPLAACDQFYGPTLTNGYGSDLVITIIYSNGRTSHGPWPTCRPLLIGLDDRVQVTHVSIERDGTVLREFSSDDIQAMQQKEESAESPSEWIIGPDGAKLLAREASPCTQKNKPQ